MLIKYVTATFALCSAAAKSLQNAVQAREYGDDKLSYCQNNVRSTAFVHPCRNQIAMAVSAAAPKGIPLPPPWERSQAILQYRRSKAARGAIRLLGPNCPNHDRLSWRGRATLNLHQDLARAIIRNGGDCLITYDTTKCGWGTDAGAEAGRTCALAPGQGGGLGSVGHARAVI
eukprot:1421156-Pleurochrysis_carterae.AAC.1